MRTKLKALTADIYRVRKHKRAWNTYTTARGYVVNTGLHYRYFNTGLPFHKTAKAIVDIQGVQSVEKHYTKPIGRVYSKRITYNKKQRKAA